MPTTRRDLRRRIARAMNDIVTLTATTGSNNMLVDPVELTDYDNTFASSQGIVVSSAHPENVGKIFRVVGNNQRGTSITFTPELPQPIEEGDVVDLVNLRGKGFRVQDYHEAINDIVRELADTTPSKKTFEYALSPVESGIPIPPEYVAIYDVDVVLDYYPNKIKPAHYTTARGWHVDRANRLVTIGGSDRNLAYAGVSFVHGLIAHPDLVSDESVCDINADYLCLQAQSQLAARRGDRNWDQWAVEWSRAAMAARPDRMKRMPANTVWLGVE